MTGDIVGGSTSSRRRWIVGSFHEPYEAVFQGSSEERREEDEKDLKWAAIEKLPTMERMVRGLVFTEENGDGKAISREIDIRNLGASDRKLLMNQIFRAVEEDNECFLLRLRAGIDRVALELPKIEVRFQDLSVEADVYAGRRALPSLLNATINTLKDVLFVLKLGLGISRTKKKVNKILILLVEF